MAATLDRLLRWQLGKTLRQTVARPSRISPESASAAARPPSIVLAIPACGRCRSRAPPRFPFRRIGRLSCARQLTRLSAHAEMKRYAKFIASQPYSGSRSSYTASSAISFSLPGRRTCLPRQPARADCVPWVAGWPHIGWRIRQVKESMENQCVKPRSACHMPNLRSSFAGGQLRWAGGVDSACGDVTSPPGGPGDRCGRGAF